MKFLLKLLTFGFNRTMEFTLFDLRLQDYETLKADYNRKTKNFLVTIGKEMLIKKNFKQIEGITNLTPTYERRAWKL